MNKEISFVIEAIEEEQARFKCTQGDLGCPAIFDAEERQKMNSFLNNLKRLKKGGHSNWNFTDTWEAGLICLLLG